jgi:hypothetical protein
MEEKDLVEVVVREYALFPATTPASAAPTNSDFTDFVITRLLEIVWLVFEWPILT